VALVFVHRLYRDERLLARMLAKFQARFERVGNLADLDRAIALLYQAMNATPPDNSGRAAMLASLGAAFQARFEQVGNLADLDRAVQAGREAVDIAPADFPGRVMYLNSLGGALLARYNCSGDMGMLDEAIRLLRQAVATTPPDPADRAGMLSNLGLALRARFGWSGEPADLEEAIDVLRDASEPPPTVAVEEERRYVNVALTTIDGYLAPSSQSLQPGGRYRLRLDIGSQSAESIVTNAVQHPFTGLPPSEDGHWLELVVTSKDLRVAARRRHFFLPTRGESWRCRCRSGGSHHCSADERQRFVTVPLRAPRQAGRATLRLGIYFRKNLVHSQLLTAAVGAPLPSCPRRWRLPPRSTIHSLLGSPGSTGCHTGRSTLWSTTTVMGSTGSWSTVAAARRWRSLKETTPSRPRRPQPENAFSRRTLSSPKVSPHRAPRGGSTNTGPTAPRAPRTSLRTCAAGDFGLDAAHRSLSRHR
jgi:tetratricopeptide (TPR) repeat protein